MPVQPVKPATSTLSTLPDSYARWRTSTLGRTTDQLEEQLLLEMLGNVAGLDVLDVGCGDALLLETLARQGACAVGLDTDPRMLQVAASRLPPNTSLQLVQASATALPFADESFDLVSAITVLCLLPDSRQALREMVRVLRPGGRLLLGELGRWSYWAGLRRVRGWLGHPVWSSANFRSASELNAMLQQHGMTHINCRGAIFYPPLAAAARVLRPLDLALGRHTTIGAAFIACTACKHL